MKGKAINGSICRLLLFQLGFWLGLIGMAQAGDDPSFVSSIDIVEKGVYESDIVARLPSPSRDVSGALLSAKPKLVQGTTRITARIGLLFGIRFKPVGDALGVVAPLHLTIIFPPPGLQNPETKQLQTSLPLDAHRTIGDIHFFGATLDSESDLVPGPWVFQISQNGRMLAEQKFDLVKPSR